MSQIPIAWLMKIEGFETTPEKQEVNDGAGQVYHRPTCVLGFTVLEVWPSRFWSGGFEVYPFHHMILLSCGIRMLLFQFLAILFFVYCKVSLHLSSTGSSVMFPSYSIDGTLQVWTSTCKNILINDRTLSSSSMFTVIAKKNMAKTRMIGLYPSIP